MRYTLVTLMLASLNFAACTTDRTDVAKTEGKADVDTMKAYNKADEKALEAQDRADEKAEKAYDKADKVAEHDDAKVLRVERDAYVDGMKKKVKAIRDASKKL